jgi:hypothetical protein
MVDWGRVLAATGEMLRGASDAAIIKKTGCRGQRCFREHLHTSQHILNCSADTSG